MTYTYWKFGRKSIYPEHSGFTPVFDIKTNKYVGGLFIKTRKAKNIKYGDAGKMTLYLVHHRYDENGKEYPNYEHIAEKKAEIEVMVDYVSDDRRFLIFAPKNTEEQERLNEWTVEKLLNYWR